MLQINLRIRAQDQRKRLQMGRIRCERILCETHKFGGRLVDLRKVKMCEEYYLIPILIVVPMIWQGPF